MSKRISVSVIGGAGVSLGLGFLMMGLISVHNPDVQPILRPAPNMPPRAEKSGHCRVAFDVSAEGSPYNVVATYCSDTMFERPTVRSVHKWKFRPKVNNGRAVPRTGVRNKIVFKLMDEQGNILPE